MPASSTEHNGLRITIVLALFFGALMIVFSPILEKIVSIINGKPVVLTQYVNLKPGIDMVGGTSLVYDIQKPEGTVLTGHLASDVAEALKKRVDPKGVKNLVWRPTGDSRLEIQMPLSPDAKNNNEARKKLREKLIAAEEALKATQVDPVAVVDAVKMKDPVARQKELDKLAADSEIRKQQFAKLTALWDEVQKAHAAKDAKTWARVEMEFNELLPSRSRPIGAAPSLIESTNVSRETIEGILSSTEVKKEDSPDAAQKKPANRVKELEAYKKQFGKFPSVIKAIDNYVDAYLELNSKQSGLDDANDLKRLLKGAGVLEYHILASGTMPEAEYRQYVEKLQKDGPRVHDRDVAKWYETDPTSKVGRTENYKDKEYVLGYITRDENGKPRSLDATADKPWHLTDAREATSQTGEREVVFDFDPQGAVYFGELTEANLEKPMAIILDNRVISAPVIRGKITSEGTITGGGHGFTQKELEYLVSTLKAGSLPAALSPEPISERTVGPQLGEYNLHAGMIACFLGLVVVAVFLCGYYFQAGVVATCAVFMNVLLVLAVMSALNATFTLPSIAGIVLSVGTAVDANVLIFERLREEQHRGLSLRLALRNAYGKAFSAILDSNMTTVITSVFLILLGTEEVKGFGVTLIIGIIASLFTALFVTRTVFNVMMDNFGLKHLRSIPLVFPKWDKLLRPNIDWMGKAWMFISFSVIGITLGLIFFGVQMSKGEIWGIEFASGTSVQFELKNKMPQNDLRELMEKQVKEKGLESALPAFAVVTVGTEETVYEVVTPSSDAVHVRDAVLKALVGKDGQSLLNVKVPSKFDGTGGKLVVAKNAVSIVAPNVPVSSPVVIPLEENKIPALVPWSNWTPTLDVSKYEPGVAIVLNNLQPKLTAEEIKGRMKDHQLGLPSGAPGKLLDFDVVTPGLKAGGDVQASSIAVVLCRDDKLSFSNDPDPNHTNWKEYLADPLWQLANESVNGTAELQQVKNFDPQVAKDAARDAMLALVLSIAVIMGYIWFRFGNLKYATATMVALLHDVLFTIAALGFAHVFYSTWIGKILQLEQFRIDLTVVAGILTIMGYSMIDTIVVFDRIRENRGKFGLESRKVINDAINQTLSRTLLTAGTNVMTVAIMYFLGGAGIHGFTFVLLIGILVGTYSSVAIAAPILLLGGSREVVARAGHIMRPARA